MKLCVGEAAVSSGGETEIHVPPAHMLGLGKYISITKSTTENLILDSLYRRGAGETDRIHGRIIYYLK